MIDSFDKKYAFLSNFAPCDILFEGLIYPTVEHAYQAAKTVVKEERVIVQHTTTPGKAKRIGKKVRLRSDWEEVKEEVMLDLLCRKFFQDKFRRLLVVTGDAELIEGNYWHDNFWGICSCSRCAETLGKNKLGEILMAIRDVIGV